MAHLRISVVLAGLLFLNACAASRLPAPTATDALPALFADWDRYDRRTDDTGAGTDSLRYFLERLQGIPLAGSAYHDSVSALVLDRELRMRIEYREKEYDVLPLTGWWDPHMGFAETGNRTRIRTEADAKRYLEQLQGWPARNREVIRALERGMATGLVRSRHSISEAYLRGVSTHISETAEASVWWKPVAEAAVGDSLKAAIAAAIRDSVLPAYRDLHAFLAGPYRAAATEDLGIGAEERGRQLYRYLIRQHVTYDISPDSVHAIGTREVSRIRAQMEQVMRETGFEGGFAEFLQFLRTDPRFYARTPEELLQRTALVLKRMDGELPRLFETLPREPYGIQAIPDYLAPTTATAYYSPGDGRQRAGHYAVNTYDLASRPIYEIEALSYHEAVPGHHLQIAWHRELQGIPAFRRRIAFTAFTEGWALYAEKLGYDVGLYQDPYSRFGQLSYDMWRALRLVVDTGIHWYGWSREEAVAYMAEHSALSLHNIGSEVDRYIFWPGQALAYKMGELRISELRRQAERAEGDAFDLRAFHARILGMGGVPLELLR